MPSTERIKEILVENERFIGQEIGRIVPRELALSPEGLKKATVLYGVRRSGKTTLLFDLFKKQPEKSLYIDFEDERLEGFQLEDLERLREGFYELKPHLIKDKGLLFLLDEIQRIDGWERFVRRVVEREGMRVVVTESSSQMMPKEIHTALRGRAWGVEILPFSFREYTSALGFPLADSAARYGPTKALLKRHFMEYLRWGGFPEVSFLKKSHEKRKVLKEYFEAMFFRDLVERFQIKNIPLLDRLMEKLFASFSLKFSLTAFWRQNKDQLSFSKDSLFSYYRYFRESMLIHEVRKFSESAYQRMRNPAKVYLVDTGLARLVTSPDWGRLLENVVYLELRRKGLEPFHFEGKRECDFAVRTEKGWSCLQVTWELSDENREREVAGLVEACRFLGLKKGLLLTYDQEGERSVGKIAVYLKPVWKWLLV